MKNNEYQKTLHAIGKFVDLMFDPPKSRDYKRGWKDGFRVANKQLIKKTRPLTHAEQMKFNKFMMENDMHVIYFDPTFDDSPKFKEVEGLRIRKSSHHMPKN